MRLGVSDRHHESLSFPLFDCPGYAGHRAPSDKEGTSRGARLCLCHPDAAQRRIDVEGVTRNAIADAPPLAVQQVRSHNLKVVIGRMGEGAATVAVAKRPDVGCAGAQTIIDDDVAACVGLNSGLVES